MHGGFFKGADLRLCERQTQRSEALLVFNAVLLLTETPPINKRYSPSP